MSHPKRLLILVLVLVGAVVFLLVPPREDFVMEGRVSLKEAPSDPRCPMVDPGARAWKFHLPAEAKNGEQVIAQSLGKNYCIKDCPVLHTLKIINIDWKARAGFFSGYSEFTFEAELVRTGEACRDRTVMHAEMWVDQGSRGDVADAADAMARWAFQWYQNRYESLYGPAS